VAVRPVVALPDHRLKVPSQAVGRIDDTARALAADLVDTMRSRPACVGLAAPQIGVGLRAFVIDVSGHRKARTCHGEVVLFDPEIVDSHSPLLAREGCLSVPDLTGDVSRAGVVVVRGLTLDGNVRTIETDAFEARAILHEVDHLDGLLFLDRVESHDRVFRRKVYR
jgi:peptide deformylase